MSLLRRRLLAIRGSFNSNFLLFLGMIIGGEDQISILNIKNRASLSNAVTFTVDEVSGARWQFCFRLIIRAPPTEARHGLCK